MSVLSCVSYRFQTSGVRISRAIGISCNWPEYSLNSANLAATLSVFTPQKPASCGSAPRCRTLCQARLRECKFCMRRVAGCSVPGATAAKTLSLVLQRDSANCPREILTPKFLDRPRSHKTDTPCRLGLGYRSCARDTAGVG